MVDGSRSSACLLSFLLAALVGCGSAGNGGAQGQGAEMASSGDSTSASGCGKANQGGTGSGGQAGSGGSPGAGETGGDSECATLRIEGDGFVVKVHGSGEVASLELSTADYEAFAKDEHPMSTRWPGLVSPLFKDNYEWHLYVLHESEAATMPGVLGLNKTIHYVADGIGIGAPNPPEFDGIGKMQSLLFLADDRQIGSGTLLHEIAHTWANYIVPELDAHWVLSDVQGLLGGVDRGTLKDLGNGQFTAPTFSSATKPQAADIEMYLAGLWPKEKVQPFTWVKNGVYVSTDADTRVDTYTGEGAVTVTIDDVIAKWGPRVPDSTMTARDWHMLPIIVTDTPLSPGDWDYYRWQLKRFTAETPAEAYDLAKQSYFSPANLRRRSASTLGENFKDVMRGEATLHADGVRDALVNPDAAVCEPEVRPGACSRLVARATSCGVTAKPCTVDTEFAAHDAACIADCAEQATCEDIQHADSGTITFELDNPFTSCAYECQCTALRSCFIVGD